MGVPGGRNPLNLAQNQPSAQIEEVNRQQRAVAAVLRGMTYAQAAEYAGYEAASSAWRAVQRALALTVEEIKGDAEMLRAKLVAQLDRAMLELSAIAYDRNIPFETRLRALESIRRNIESRAKITGAMAPIQHEMITPEHIDRELAALAQRLGLPLPDRIVIDGYLAEGAGAGALPQAAPAPGAASP